MGIVAASSPLRTERYGVHGMTCGACVRHIQAALGAVPGVMSVRVDLGTATATVERDPAAAPAERLFEAVADAGYTLDVAGPGRRVPMRPFVFGALASLGLLAVYLGLVTLAQGWDHAASLLAEDAPFVLPIVLGFGTQVGLFTVLQAQRVAASGGVAASTGTSGAAMLACCAHHLVDVLPVVGLSGAALFLGAYKTQLLWLGLGMNGAGIGSLLWQLRRGRTAARCAAGADATGAA